MHVEKARIETEGTLKEMILQRELYTQTLGFLDSRKTIAP